jgi:hypothetical protein
MLLLAKSKCSLMQNLELQFTFQQVVLAEAWLASPLAQPAKRFLDRNKN